MKPSQFHTNRKLHNWYVYLRGDEFLESAKDIYKGTLYDLGCGEATFKDYFLQYCERYVGVDWAECRHDSKADIIADLNKPIPDIDNNSADTAVSLSVIEHLSEPQTMVNEAFRILKPGGHFIIQVPWQWQIHEAPYDYFRYTPYGLKHMLGKAGFEDIDVQPQSGFFTMIFTKINYFLRRFVRGPKPVQWLVLLIMVPIWTILQLLAPLLDVLDRNKASEAAGYFVTCRKPLT